MPSRIASQGFEGAQRLSMMAPALALIVTLGACAPCPKCPGPEQPAPVTARYQQTDFAALPGWAANAASGALPAFLAACARLRQGAALALACARAREVPQDDDVAARGFFASTFTPYALSSSEGETRGLITGYYEPVLAGRRARSARFHTPVFGVPSDMIVVDLASLYPDLKHRRLRGRIEGRRLVPYYSRAEIEDANERFEAPVLAWVADPVALFFLQIQGSGQIEFDDGSRLRLGYADQNGHPYRSLGRYLVERGEMPLDQASMQGIQAWAEAHPDKLRAALDANPSYVFFRVLPDLPAQDGPIGALGVPLRAGASLRRLDVPVARRRRRHEILQQVLGDVRDVVDRTLEDAADEVDRLPFRGDDQDPLLDRPCEVEEVGVLNEERRIELRGAQPRLQLRDPRVDLLRRGERVHAYFFDSCQIFSSSWYDLGKSAW